MSYSTKFIGKQVKIKVDRPLGSAHPKYPDMIYSINYGFVEGTIAPDGEELDAYILGVSKPVSEFTGTCIAVIKRSDDDDDKLIVVPTEPNYAQYTDEKILELTHFQEQYFKSKILRK